VLLGTILYGAWSVVNSGPSSGPAAVADAAAPPLASAPPFAPQVDMPVAAVAPRAAALPPQPAPPSFAPPPLASAPPAAQVEPTPTYLNAASAPPPVAEHLPSERPEPPPSVAALAGTPAGAPTAGNAISPSDSRQQPSAAFASAWADAHDKLAAGRYAEALAVLSTWYDDATLGVEESQRLEELLGQLAGTVIYSQQDLLLPPHVVEPGETLLTIAAPLGVSWQLLAKINGVPDPAKLVPGESLKLVRGPFDAVVSVSRRRLSLRVGGNYAGSFPVIVGRGVRDRIGVTVPVVAVQRGAVPAEQAGPAAQVAWSQPGPRAIALGEGLAIEAVPDPSTVPDETVPGTSLLVSERDLDDLADILGAGSRVILRQ
jgi:LysM repeat protein